MRTCAATKTKLHLIKPLGFSLDEKVIKRSGANYINECDYTVYENWDDFLSKNDGEFLFFNYVMDADHIRLLIIVIEVKIFIWYLEKRVRAFLKKF